MVQSATVTYRDCHSVTTMFPFIVFTCLLFEILYANAGGFLVSVRCFGRREEVPFCPSNHICPALFGNSQEDVESSSNFVLLSLTLLRMGRLYCRPRAIGGTLFVRLFLNLFRCYHVRYLCTVCEYSSIAACQIYTHALMHQLLDLFEDKSYLTTRMVCPILKKITQTAWTAGTTSTFSLFRYDSR